MRAKGENLKFLATLLLQFLIIVVIFIIEVSYGGQKMRLYSEAFKDGDRIPLKYVMPLAGGQNVSPPLNWEGVPSEAKSLVLLCYDPHPVAKNWVHWIVINIPPEVKELPEDASTKLPDKPSYDQIISAIRPYVIAEAKITGYFGR